jgi:hypothetical protein
VLRTRAILAALAVPALALLAAPATAAKPKPRVVTGLLPGMHGKGVNHDAEPALAAGPDGVLWATSNALSLMCGRPTNCGSDIWRSTNGGRTWAWVANPFLTADPTGTYAMGGGDGDIAVAPVKNASGHYNVYVASLWVSNSVAVSRDGGKTWEVQPLESAPGSYGLVPVALPVTPPSAPASAFADRPWIGADGACGVYFAYNQLPGNVTFMQHYDACQPVLVKNGLSVPFTVDAAGATYTGKVSGRFVVDTAPKSKYLHTVYYPAVANRKVMVSVSTDGVTWTPRTVAPFSDEGVVPVWPVTAAVDATGRLYVAWHDSATSWVASSADSGAHWTTPVRLNRGATTAVYPTVAAARSGEAVVLWYGTSREGPSSDLDAMGAPGGKRSAAWQVYESRTRDGGRSWSEAVALTGPVHRGAVCVRGGGCLTDGSRNLLDDFGVVMVPGTSRAVAVFTNDQPGGGRPDRKTGFLAEL